MKTIDLYDDSLKQEILNLPYNDKIGDEWILIPESDYGFAEIYRMHNDILVFLIPMYGGSPSFFKGYGLHAVDYLIKELRGMC